MMKLIKLNEANDLKDQIADGKSILGLMALDYTKPVKVVSDDEYFMKCIEKWEV